MITRLAHASIAVLLLALATTGCARKSVEAPPLPAPAASVPAPSSEPEPAAPATAPQTESTPQPAAEFQPAFFEYDSYMLSSNAREALDADARVLRGQPGLSVIIEGHCDERGTAEYNQALGERRASAARDYLVASGIEASRIRTISYGKERPLVEGQGEIAWSQNRRAHVVAG
jgi:peptidoglycan-associated lipoprotein